MFYPLYDIFRCCDDICANTVVVSFFWSSSLRC